MEIYPPPKNEITAEDILGQLIRDVRESWTPAGVRLWAEKRIEEINAPAEQLVLFKED